LVGYDFVARAGGDTDPAAGSALYGFLDRRLIVIDSSYTALEAQMQGTISGSRLTITTPDCHWALPPNNASTYTDLMVGHDLVEVMTSAYAGTYLLQSVGRGASSTPAYAELQTFAGTMLNTPPNTAVSFRVFRPQFATGGKARPGALGSGVVITALPSEGSSGAAAAALTLVPGQRGPVLQADEGVGYALAVKVLADTGGYGWMDEVGITALGTFHARNPQVNLGGAMPSSFARALAGFRYANEQPSGNVLGFLAHNKATPNTKPFYGVVAQERRDGELAGQFATTNIIVEPALSESANSERYPAIGALVEVWAAGAEVGTYRVRHVNRQSGAGTMPKVYQLDSLNGSPATFPGSGACSIYVLEGTVLGHQEFVHPYPGDRPGPTKVTAAIAGPVDDGTAGDTNTTETHVALQVSSQSYADHSLLIRGLDAHGDELGHDSNTKWSREVFSVSRAGAIKAASSVTASSFILSDEIEVADFCIPLEFWQPAGPGGSARWYRNNGGPFTLEAPAGPGTALLIPLTGVVPYGAHIWAATIRYKTINYSNSFACTAQITRQYLEDEFPVAIGSPMTMTAAAATDDLYFDPSVDITRSGPLYSLLIKNGNVTYTNQLYMIYKVFVNYTLSGALGG
jgi:hypothetical protein